MRAAEYEFAAAGPALRLPPLVLDLAVLLSPFGLWLVQRLALAGQVWLPPIMPRLLEETLDDEGLVDRLDTCLGIGDHGALERGLVNWRRAWPQIIQSPCVFWFADALDTSRARKGLPPAMIDRLDELKAGLAARACDGDALRLDVCDPVLDAGRDVVALAATLAAERALVLSAPLPGRFEPALCAALDHHRVPHHQLEPGPHRELLLTAVLPTLQAAQVLSLLASGALRLALIHLVAPEAMRPLPPARPAPGTELFTDDEPGESELGRWPSSEHEASLWEGAMALWHDVTWQ